MLRYRFCVPAKPALKLTLTLNVWLFPEWVIVEPPESMVHWLLLCVAGELRKMG